jgi:hypothetical protein
MTNSPSLSALLDFVLEHLDIPKSYYDKAAARHRSLGKWLHRPESTIAVYDPDVRPQGSFRYGTVIRPINEGDEYDLDNVCVFNKLDKCVLTQEELKRLYGEEVKAYAKANGMLAPVIEHNRCWRLCYADEVSFHLDTLPCVPEDNRAIARIASADVPVDLAKRAVAITDKGHPKYREVCSEWLSSNPRGFAAWFEHRAFLGRQRRRGSSQIRMAVEDVPPYEWKTTLQRSIQILKRHRDIMFKDEPNLAPISMIITNLAARAYQGEEDIATAINTIVAGMPQHVREGRPRVPNPADPGEDYADKWARNPHLEANFWSWWTAVKSDLATLGNILGTFTLGDHVEKTFQVRLTQEHLDVLGINTMLTRTAASIAPTLVIPSAVRPWGSHD